MTRGELHEVSITDTKIVVEQAMLHEAMPDNILDLVDLGPRLRRFDRLLGIDLGTKTIGVAVSDVERRLASPVTTIRRTRFQHDATALLKEAARLEAAALVIGWPAQHGRHGGAARAGDARLHPQHGGADAAALRAVGRAPLDGGGDAQPYRAGRLARQRAAVVDRMAAAYILQGALDRLARLVAEAQ